MRYHTPRSVDMIGWELCTVFEWNLVVTQSQMRFPQFSHEISNKNRLQTELAALITRQNTLHYSLQNTKILISFQYTWKSDDDNDDRYTGLEYYFVVTSISQNIPCSPIRHFDNWNPKKRTKTLSEPGTNEEGLTTKYHCWHNYFAIWPPFLKDVSIKDCRSIQQAQL